MSKYNKNHLENEDLGKWASASSEQGLTCKNDDGCYGTIRKMVDSLELTDEEYKKIYKKRRN